MYNPILEQIENRKRENYTEAFKDTIKAIKSIEKLDDYQKEQLCGDVLVFCALQFQKCTNNRNEFQGDVI